MVEYDKLVRDNIINIIKNKGKKANYHICSDSEHLQYLVLKLNEETEEFNEDYSIEELADVIEVIEALKKLPKYSNVEEIRLNKIKSNGAFNQRIILDEVID